jgi:threonine synthase
VARGVGSSVTSYLGLVTLERSDGLAVDASDRQILEAQADLARHGIFVETSSAVGLAGLRELARRGGLAPSHRIVLVNTSAGVKNLEGAAERYAEPLAIAGSFDALATALEARTTTAARGG